MPTPSAPHPRRPALPLTAALCLSGLLAASEARALTLEAGYPRELGGRVVVDARLDQLFGPRVGESLARGMPATVQLHAELWRERVAWFDRLESSFDAAVRLRYEVWNEVYRIERAGAPAITVPTLDSLRAVLARPWALPVSRVGALKPRARYYVVLSATLEPLSVEDVAEVEGWLSGEFRARRGRSVITELPRSVFDAVRNFAGFGDERARAVTPDFTLADLFASP